MDRIILHWTAGAKGLIPIEEDSYHEIFQPDGSWEAGDFTVEANRAPLRKGHYAAHTLNCNTNSIGLAADAMAGAQERPFRWGSNPLTDKQITAMLARAAHYCRKYNIPVTRKTVLTHAEVQTSLGIRQNNKWDIMVLPGMSKPGNAVEVGDILRQRLRVMMNETAPKPLNPITLPTLQPKFDWDQKWEQLKAAFLRFIRGG